MAGKNNIHSGTIIQSPSQRELIHRLFAREAASQGIVLLKNEGILPLDQTAVIALFGAGAKKTVKGGIGSGDVNNRENVSIYEGLTDAGVSITSKDWLFDYERRYADARAVWKNKILEDAKGMENPFDAYAANPFVMPIGRSIQADDIEGATAAVYVISRISGEGKDRRREEGDYDLSKAEREDILFLNSQNIPMILILNVGAPIELTGILQEVQNIQAVLHSSLPGQEGGHALADVLLGGVSPSGRLTTTWARRYEDYPSAETFGYLNNNLDYEEYREGIYVGYRYFDSFDIKPLFPFGYGLSYTDFSIQTQEIRRTETGFEVTVTVQNTGGTYAGREVVQVYAVLPQTGLAKELRRLVGFAKTNTLQPKETQRLTIAVDQKQFASFSEELHAWTIEQGEYGVWVGSHLASLQPAALFTVAEQAVLEETDAICPKTAAFEELAAPETVRQKAQEYLAAAKAQAVMELSFVPQKEIHRTIETPAAKEYDVEELIPLLYGKLSQEGGMLGAAGISIPGSAGETADMSDANDKNHSLVMADGPAGLRLRQSYAVDRKTDTVYGTGVLGSLENGFLEDVEAHENVDWYYQYCTAFPVGTALAQTWDTALMERFGKAIAVEMEEFHIDLWLAPGMNIHRNPLCGRNFEYYAEDPFLSGMMAAAVTKGVQSDGSRGVTIKHFACNNQEDNRMGVDARISERALREIYLRGFEIAVKESAPAAIMTSYNCINGVHAANSRDLCTTVARGEWGFEGIIMSDWNTTLPKDGSVPWQCAAAGNDIIMPGNRKDAENIRTAYTQGLLPEEAIRACAGRILALMKRLSGE